MFGLTHGWLRELSSSRLECGVHDKLHISSADWLDILLPLALTPDRRDQRPLVSHTKDTEIHNLYCREPGCCGMNVIYYA